MLIPLLEISLYPIPPVKLPSSFPPKPICSSEMFTCRVKFPIFRLRITMVWNNSTALATFITSVVTSFTDFGAFISVIGSSNLSTYDPNSCTILFPNSNSNGNPSTNFGLLGGTCSCANLNSSKAGYFTTLSVCNSVACNPSYVYYCCSKWCCKCWKCFGLVMASIQSSHTSFSKCRCSSLFENLMSCSLLTPWLYSLNYLFCGDVIYGISCFCSLVSHTDRTMCGSLNF